ncbi:unnamed protein product [Prorocentrum cordatum]|uniref:Uncharacterized protein n=1 Tax=Prorocentrum cordatum TaxID=2364126 RepID=A0ABN9QAE9_9DINO|nr:unnamed protein product [Polarella glacialis]
MTDAFRAGDAMEVVGAAPAEGAVPAGGAAGAAAGGEAAQEGAAPGKETHHDLRRRQVAEWKKMKAEVALMKRQRKKVPGKKNGGKDDKKALSSKIRALISGLRAKHETELRDAGIEVTAEDSGVDAEAYISGEED